MGGTFRWWKELLARNPFMTIPRVSVVPLWGDNGDRALVSVSMVPMADWKTHRELLKSGICVITWGILRLLKENQNLHGGIGMREINWFGWTRFTPRIISCVPIYKYRIQERNSKQPKEKFIVASWRPATLSDSDKIYGPLFPSLFKKSFKAEGRVGW